MAVDPDLLLGTGLSPGRRLGRYQLVAPIGRGGMAVVWAARASGSHGFSKLVAVKTILPVLRADPRFEKMFLAEASLCSRLDHANVCQVLDLGESDGQLYLVMEWVGGDTLAALLGQTGESLPVGVATRIVIDVARGLHAAHTAPEPSVHRDVSPQNILVGRDGLSKIADFGIAKREGGPVTQAGYVKGKVRYMAPEQVYCEEVEARTDLFALGVVLYEATTGKHPFAQATDVATLAAIAAPDEAAPPCDLVADYPAALEAVVLRAVAKDAAARFATAAALADALEETGVAASHDDVAKYLERTCGARLARRQSAIEAQRVDDHSGAGVALPTRGGRAPAPRTAIALACLAVAGVVGLAFVVASARPVPDEPVASGHEEAAVAAPPPAPSPDRASLATPPSQTAAADTSATPPGAAASPAARAPSRPGPSQPPSSARAASATAGAPTPPASTQKSGVLETRE